VSAELASATVAADELAVVDLLVATGLVKSKSDARRTITEGGAYVNNAKVSDVDQVVSADELLHGKYLLLRRGKKNLASVTVA